jgi:translation elongation factor EF-1alpha
MLCNAAAAAAAGKSTLMGRLLSELGQVSQKEVHKNQKESAQAGKVRATQQQQQQDNTRSPAPAA